MKSKSANKPRVRSLPKHRSFRISKKRLKQPAAVPGALALFAKTFGLLRTNKRLFLGIALINLIISFVFVQGVGSAFNIVDIKQNFEELLGKDSSRVNTGVALFSYLLGSAGSTTSQAAGTYQLFLILTTSLAVIWAVRQVLASEKPAVRDSFYKGMYPLIPFLLILFVIGLQLVPLLLGNLIFSTVIQNGLAVTTVETAVWLLLYACLAVLSFYMLTSSLFALYISTLPDMTPLKALRSARQLVLHRRFAVALRIIALPAVLLLLSALIFIPLLIFAAPAA